MPISYWPNPKIASLFFESLRRCEVLLTVLKFHLDPEPAPGKEKWNQYVKVLDETYEMADLIGAYFNPVTDTAMASIAYFEERGMSTAYEFVSEVEAEREALDAELDALLGDEEGLQASREAKEESALRRANRRAHRYGFG